jgi:hypothetical protein
MVSMRIFAGGGALGLLFHDHRDRKLASSYLHATRGLEEKVRLFFLYSLAVHFIFLHQYQRPVHKKSI